VTNFSIVISGQSAISVVIIGSWLSSAEGWGAAQMLDLLAELLGLLAEDTLPQPLFLPSVQPFPLGPASSVRSTQVSLTWRQNRLESCLPSVGHRQEAALVLFLRSNCTHACFPDVFRAQKLDERAAADQSGPPTERADGGNYLATHAMPCQL
jgi:hypothetical protein